MRKILLIVAACGMMFMAGWFQIQRDGEETFIKINRDEIRTDARKAIAKGREFLDRGEQRLDEREQQLQADDYSNAGYSDSVGRYDNRGYQADPYAAPQYPSDGYQDPRYQSNSNPSTGYPPAGYQAQPYQADGAQYDTFPRR